MEIELCGYRVLIDDDDYEKIKKLSWHLDKKALNNHGLVYFVHGYRDSSNKSRAIYLHRLVLNLKLYDGIFCDHVNGNTLDNRKSNLRKCSPQENSRNAKKPVSNTSGLKGASFINRDKVFQSSIKINGKSVYLGQYKTAQEAHNAYCEASKKYHGEFGRTE
jgi:hypothetical protein